MTALGIKNTANGSRFDPGIARHENGALSLLVHVSPRGVEAIIRDKNIAVGQMVFWDDGKDNPPALENVEPHGPQLAHELDSAMSGRPVENQVPWVPSCPAWHLDLYRHVRQLPPGVISELPDSLFIDGKYRDRRVMLEALRKCLLAPLVPLHRVCGTGKGSIRFPWGRKWQEILLKREADSLKKTNVRQRTRPTSEHVNHVEIDFRGSSHD